MRPTLAIPTIRSVHQSGHSWCRGTGNFSCEGFLSACSSASATLQLGDPRRSWRNGSESCIFREAFKKKGPPEGDPVRVMVRLSIASGAHLQWASIGHGARLSVLLEHVRPQNAAVIVRVLLDHASRRRASAECGEAWLRFPGLVHGRQ